MTLTLAKAIEILTYWENDLNSWNNADNDSAIMLGIEALKRIQTRRIESHGSLGPLLPGETED